MHKFIYKLFGAMLPILLVFSYPAYISERGICSGDICTVYDGSYLRFFSHKPEFEERAKETDDIRKDIKDSTVLVIGDSFSQLGSRSFVTYLQHYLDNRQVLLANTRTSSFGNLWQYVHASLKDGDERLLVFTSMTDYVIYMLENADTLPHTIVIETAENYMVERFSTIRTNLNETMFEDYTQCAHRLTIANAQKDEASGNNRFLFEDSPIKRYKNSFTFIQKWCKNSVGIKKRKKLSCKKELFSARGFERDLFVNTTTPCSYTPDDIANIKRSMQYIFEMGRERGVNIIFFICPNKYDLFQPYLTDIQHNGMPLLHEALSQAIPTEYYIDNYELLDSCIRIGTKDIYLSTDTHWSYIAADITAKNLANKIREKL